MHIARIGDIFGSPLYMSPEQCQGNMQDRRSDIYSLGCLMYEALTGVQAYAADNPIKIILRHINEDAQPISKLKHEYNIPKDLEDVVMRCLERLPEDRYQSADELLRDLRKVRDGAKVKLAPLRKKKTETPRRLSLAKFTLTSFAVMSALAALAVVYGIYSGLDPFPDAQSFDSKSYGYFVSGQYEKAAPLLEFGISTYKERLEQDRANGDTDAARRDETLLAENYQHIGKCHLKMAEKAAKNGDAAKATQEYEKAKNAYKEAMPFYYRYGNWPGASSPEAVRDYAAVLRALNDSKELQALSEFARRFNLSM